MNTQRDTQKSFEQDAVPRVTILPPPLPPCTATEPAPCATGKFLFALGVACGGLIVHLVGYL